jgi:hypothetical protein
LPRGAWKPASDCAGTDARLDEVMLKAMGSDPADRYQNVEAMKSDILHVMNTPLRRAGSVSMGPVAHLPKDMVVPVQVLRVDGETPAAPRRMGAGSPMSRPATPLPRRQAAPARRAAASPPARGDGWVSGLIAGLVCTIIVACALGLPSLEPKKGQSRPVELIDLNALKGVPLAGHWSATREGLQCKPAPARAGGRDDERMRIYDLRYSPPQEYDFELEFTRTRGSIVHVLSAEGCTFVHELKPARPDEPEVRSGFNGLDGVRLEQASEGYGLVAAPEDSSRHVLTVQVRHDMVRSLLDGNEVALFRGDITRLALPKPLRLGGDAGHLGIASRGGDVIFHRATVREISGPGAFSYPNGSQTGPGLTATGTSTVR